MNKQTNSKIDREYILNMANILNLSGVLTKSYIY